MVALKGHITQLKGHIAILKGHMATLKGHMTTLKDHRVALKGHLTMVIYSLKCPMTNLKWFHHKKSTVGRKPIQSNGCWNIFAK